MTLVILTVVLLLSLGAAASIETITKRSLHRAHEAAALSIGRAFAAASLDAVLVEDILDLRGLMSSLMEADPDLVYLMILDDDGRVIASTFSGGVPVDLPDANTLESTEEQSFQRLRTEDGIVLDLALPLFEGNVGVVRVGLSEASLREALLASRASLLAVTLGAALLALLLSWALGRAIARPIEDLTARAVLIQKGDLSMRAQSSDVSEMQVLAGALNGMLDALVDDIEHRMAAEAELVRARDDLEIRVAERTEQLADMNEELGATNEELSATNEELTAANEELRVLNAQLEEANLLLAEATQARSAFFAAMSHELRTPLNVVIGFTDLMMKGLAGPVTEEQARQLEMVHAAGSHLLALINDVLDMARMDRDHIRPRLVEVDPRAVASQAFAALGQMGERKGLTMTLELADDLPAVVSDATRVEQILMNLLGNAIKYTEAGFVTLSVRRGADSVVFEVIDSGIGIPPDAIDRIFDEFFQVRPGQEGSGLGLAICRQAAETIGAVLEAESTDGVGSTFTLSIPLHPSRA